MMTSTQIAAVAAKTPNSSKHQGRRVRETALDLYGLVDLAEADFHAIYLERDRQAAIRVARRQRRETTALVGGRFERECAARKNLARLNARIAVEEAAEKQHRATRRAGQAALRRLGFRLEHSKDGSNYYERCEVRTVRGHLIAHVLAIRLSDHEVPMTEERHCNVQDGRFTWADAANSFVIDDFSTPAALVAAVTSYVRRDFYREFLRVSRKSTTQMAR